MSRYFRARSGSTVDAKREFGWKDDRMANRYDHVRPAEERLARPPACRRLAMTMSPAGTGPDRFSNAWSKMSRPVPPGIS